MIFSKECYLIRGAAMNVHSELGCGFLEEVYQEAMEKELSARGVPFISQPPLNLYYKGELMKKYYRPDLICYGEIIVELKSAVDIHPMHKAQLINYLKATRKPIGLLINFGETSCHIETLFNNKSN